MGLTARLWVELMATALTVYMVSAVSVLNWATGVELVCMTVLPSSVATVNMNLDHGPFVAGADAMMVAAVGPVTVAEARTNGSEDGPLGVPTYCSSEWWTS